MKYTQTLTLMTQWYNKLKSTILAVELGLVKDEMDGVRQQLEPALKELTWAQDDLWDYIQSTQQLVKVITVFFDVLRFQGDTWNYFVSDIISIVVDMQCLSVKISLCRLHLLIN